MASGSCQVAHGEPRPSTPSGVPRDDRMDPRAMTWYQSLMPDVTVLPLGFMVDTRPHVFLADALANERFLQGIDPDYWAYQADAHASALVSEDASSRQRAAASLRLAYGHGLETLFALICGFIQCPRYPLAWLMRYTNSDLRSVVSKLHRGDQFPNALVGSPSWERVSAVVHAIAPADIRDALTQRYAELWRRLAHDFLDERFEPEYNSLKHGMRPAVGGFSVAAGVEPAPGTAPAEMQTVGGSDFGSTFWLPARRMPGCRHTFELSTNVTMGWEPGKFVQALPLIRDSVRNITARALVYGGRDLATVKLGWPSDMNQFDAPWKHAPTIGSMASTNTTELLSWSEPTAADILRTYDG